MIEKLYERSSLTPVQISFTTPVLLIGFVAFVTQAHTVGFIALTLWLLIATSRNGAEIDYSVKQVNFYIRLFGIKLDSWEKLSKYHAYIIRKKSSSAHYVSRYQERTFHSEKTILGLIKNDPKNFKIIKVDSKENLLKFGLQLEEKTGLKRHITKR